MRKFHIRTNARGFSLIEVLLSVAIMSFGLLALTSLQLSMIRSSSESKAQSVALGLAKDKLEELKNYRVLDDNTCSASIDSYQCITDSTSAESITESATVYSRTWVVDHYRNVAGTFTVVGDTVGPPTTPPRNEFKAVRVIVSWVDATGATQRVSLKDAISALAPTDSALLQKPNVGATPRPAVARINNPGLVAGVIPIAVGGGTASAATNPRPTVISGQFVTETRFDVLTYSGINGGSADAQSRVETLMVGCKCDTATAPASTVRGYRPTYWNGKRYTVPEEVPTSTSSPDFGYSPPAGQRAGVSQSVRCAICCRDHHDPAGTNTAVFSPYRSSRSSGGVVTAAHQHFNSTATGATPVTTGVYSEACRVIRSDGVFRVATDINNDYFGLLATENLSTTNPVSAANQLNYASSIFPDDYATKRYQTFVTDYIDERYTTKTSATAFNTPLNASTIATLEGAQAVTLAGVTRSTDLNEPGEIKITAPTTIKTLHSRGLYIDYLEQEAIDAVTDAKTSCSSQAAQALSECVLKVLPFTSINLTEIADWRDNNAVPIVADDSSVPLTVTNNNFALTSTTVRRAQVTAQASPANRSATVYTFGGKSNSGLLDLSFGAISPDDAVSKIDRQLFEVNPDGAVVAGPNDGSFYANLTVMPTGFVGTPAVAYVTTGQPAGPCNTGSPVTNNTCVVANSTDGVNGLGVAGGMSVDVLNYNRTQTIAMTSPSISGCTGTGNATGFAAKSSGSVSYNANQCYNYVVESATNTGPTGVLNTPSLSFTTVFDGETAERTRIAFALINNLDIITVQFALAPSSITTLTPSSTGGTCTFSCAVLNLAGTDCNSVADTTFAFTAPTCP